MKFTVPTLRHSRSDEAVELMTLKSCSTDESPEQACDDANARDSLVWTIVSKSKILQELSVPTIWKLAFAASCRSCSSDDDAKSLVLETLRESPLLAHDLSFKAEITALVEVDDWETLLIKLKCPGPAPATQPPTEKAIFERYRMLALAIFMRSRKVASLPADQQLSLKTMIHAATSQEDIVGGALRAVDAAADLFDPGECERVRADLVSQRYDRMLAPESLDVDEDDDCPICMSAGSADTRLPCGHLFCASCVLELARRNRNDVCCPMCRQHTLLTRHARGDQCVEVLRGYADVLRK